MILTLLKLLHEDEAASEYVQFVGMNQACRGVFSSGKKGICFTFKSYPWWEFLRLFHRQRRNSFLLCLHEVPSTTLILKKVEKVGSNLNYNPIFVMLTKS